MGTENKAAMLRRAGASPDGRRAQRLTRVAIVVEGGPRDDLERVEGFLAREGAEIRKAESSAVALSLLRERLPDVLVSALALPVSPALALIAEIRKDPLLQCVAAIAVGGTLTHRFAAEEAGFDRFFVEPVDLETLAAEIVRMVGVKRRAVGS
jgi:DNA-binding response OmpR family regulator